jgi:hypothetical protein
MAKRGQKRSRESHPRGAFQVEGYDDPPGVDLQDDFAEWAIVQEALENMNENQQMTGPKIENGRVIVVEILTAHERSEWRTRTEKAPCEKHQYESGVSEMNNVRNEVNH